MSIDELNDMKDVEKVSDGHVNTILQLRSHPQITKFKKKIEDAPSETKYDISLDYVTPRGKWYYESWKGNEDRSGGIAMNIGIHLFDMLVWIFGDVMGSRVFEYEKNSASGNIKFGKANVNWSLSIDPNDLPGFCKVSGKRSFRLMSVSDGIKTERIDFSNGFTDLHTVSYDHILNGFGWGIEDVRKSIELVNQINKQK